MNEDFSKILKLIQEFKSGILTTIRQDGSLHSRPMVVAQMSSEGGLYFITSMDSPKAKEIEANPVSNVTFQEETKKIVVLSGQSKVTHDRKKLEEFWNPEFEAWFTEGIDSPDVCLIEFNPSRGEFWDTSGIKSLKYYYETAKSALLGGTPELDEDSHGSTAM